MTGLWRGRVCLAALALQLTAAGACRSAGRSSPESSPVGTVRAYYAALEAHEFVEAEASVATETRTEMAGAVDADATNLLSLARLTVDSSRPVGAELLPGMAPGVELSAYDEFAQVSVQYDATFRRVFGDPNGRLTRFLYLGRTAQGHRWLILAIGSGP